MDDRLATAIAKWFAPRPAGSAAEWARENLVIPGPQTQTPGPFSVVGREYMREPIECFSAPDVSDVVLCFGSQTGKTTVIMAGVAWFVGCQPSTVLWVLPSSDLAKSFSATRWTPVLRASPSLEALIPKGALRHDFAKKEQRIGASTVNFVGSNSPANLASRPARIVVLDEVDKFPVESKHGEADAVNLAEQRTKGFADPKRIKTSTPTEADGLIWQEFLKGDQRRFFAPCPHCQKLVVLAWSPQYTIFPKTGEEAFVRWDKEARRTDGAWDLDRVERSAHAECPHCHGEIRDTHKTLLNRGGEWRATERGSYGWRSYHLPSLYAATPQTTFGRLAVQFLQQKRSELGLLGFIQGCLAEPYQSQDTAGLRTERVVRIQSADGWRKLLTVDCQAKSPAFWFVVRAWRDGETTAIEAGHAETWEELREVQQRHAIDDRDVAVDSGFGARSDAEVYRNCMRFGTVMVYHGRGVHVGWLPCKGFPGRRRWKDKEGGTQHPYIIQEVDPFRGTADGGRVTIQLFEFSADWFKDLLAELRAQKGVVKWGVSDAVATDEYWRHMDGEMKQRERSAKTGMTRYAWVRRGTSWPNHLFDCEVMQLAVAQFLDVLVMPQQETQQQEESK